MPEAKVAAGAFTILRNRAALARNLLSAVQRVEVTQEVNVPTMFSFEVSMLTRHGAWQGANLDAFAPGDEIAIKLGPGSTSLLVTGLVTAINPAFSDEDSTVTIHGFDRTYALRFGRHSRPFSSKSVPDIVRQVASEAKMTVSTLGMAGAPIPYVMQRGQTDYEFLVRLCKNYDYELAIDTDGKTLVLRPSAQGDSPVKTLAYGRDFEQLHLELKVPTLGASVTAIGYDITTNKAVKVVVDSATPRERMDGEETGYESAARDFPSTAIIVERPDLASPQALEEAARAEYERHLMGFIEGGATIVGDSQVPAGVNVKLMGISQRFDGIYYVTKSTHRYENNVYTNTIGLRRSGI